jgi:hypothetical protein
MAESPHYKELLQLLNEFEVEYLIVGGYAVMKYGEPRYTKDLDVWVRNSAQNSIRVVAALKQFGAPLEHDGINAETFTGKQVVYQIGVAFGENINAHGSSLGTLAKTRRSGIHRAALQSPTSASLPTKGSKTETAPGGIGRSGTTSWPGSVWRRSLGGTLPKGPRYTSKATPDHNLGGSAERGEEIPD